MNTNKYIGTPFKDNGRGPAFDCWGLVHAVYRDEFGIDVPSYDKEYFTVKDIVIPKLIELESVKWKRTENPKEGDVILFKLNGNPSHIGIITKPGYMMHTLFGSETVIESYCKPLWDKRIDGIYRHTSRC